MATTTLTSKGQVTIPQKVREHLGLGAGDKVDFVIASDGVVYLRLVAGSVRRLYGFLKRPSRRAPTVEEMDESIMDHLSQENARTAKSDE
jgi:AbrB family looped-hinge helix DNA binding protein